MRTLKIICYVISAIILGIGILIFLLWDMVLYILLYCGFFEGCLIPMTFLPIGTVLIGIGIIGIWLTKTRLKDKTGIKEVK